MKPQNTFGGIVDATIELVSFYKSKVEYEVDCELRKALDEKRKALFESDSLKCRIETVDLAVCKLKLDRLKKDVAELPDSLASKLAPLICKFEGRIAESQRSRKLFFRRGTAIA